RPHRSAFQDVCFGTVGGHWGVSTSNVGELVVHEVLFGQEDEVNAPVSSNSSKTHVLESRPVWSWSAPEHGNLPRDIRPSSIALNDKGDTWLVAWVHRDQLYWKLEHASAPEMSPTNASSDALITHTPEVVYLGRSWAIVYTQSYRRISSSGSELTTTTAHMILNNTGHVVQTGEINSDARSTQGSEYLFPQVTRTHKGPVIATMRERNPISNVPFGLRAYRPRGTVTRLSSPHPLRASHDEQLRTFFPFTQRRPFDVHGFGPIDASSSASNQPEFYAVWSYARSGGRWRLMGSKITLAPDRTILKTSCLPW
ncbi:MAG: hypothetical protein AAFX99_10375, partial [Myxococcota bacterium]